MNKFCTFPGEQRDLVTCMNPIEMLEIGVFNNDFTYMDADTQQFLFSKLDTHHKIAPENAFVEWGAHHAELEPPMIQRQQFFSWYVDFYYKRSDWEERFQEHMLPWYKSTLIELYKKLATANEMDMPRYKQGLLELAWSWKQNPSKIY